MTTDSGQYLTFALAGEVYGIPILAGCLVDAVSDVVSVSADSEVTTPSACGTTDTHFLAGLASIDRQLVMLVHLVRLVESSIVSSRDSAAA